MAYFTAEELQNRMGSGDFSATSLPDTTMVGDMATEVSAMLDGLVGQDEGDYTPTEQQRQACISAAVYQVDQIRAGEPVDPEVQIRIIQKSILGISTKKPRTSWYVSSPDVTGEW